MAFKGVATTASGNLSNKVYMWVSLVDGAGIQHWTYVTADPLATVDGSNYITDQDFIDVLRVGDIVTVYVVGSIDDTRSIHDDLAAGITDYGMLMVLENTGTVVDLSDDFLGGQTLGGVITYGD